MSMSKMFLAFAFVVLGSLALAIVAMFVSLAVDVPPVAIFLAARYIIPALLLVVIVVGLYTIITRIWTTFLSLEEQEGVTRAVGAVASSAAGAVLKEGRALPGFWGKAAKWASAYWRASRRKGAK